ncbi:MAG: DUF3108 domain-containing protein [Gammaproteobacteria bacterium]|nr:DUF3108 domain-containing protein [Gammaproteobacteria bacterium]
MTRTTRLRLGFMPAALLAMAVLLAVPARAQPAPAAGSTPTDFPATLAIPAFKMHYQVLRNGWHIGAADFILERDGDAWHFHSKAWPTGFASWFVDTTFTESSRFEIVDHRIRPIKYSYTDSGSPSHNERIRFDWSADTARDREGKSHVTAVPIEPGMLDRLSAQLRISRQLAAGVPLEEPFRIVHGGAVSLYRLERVKTGTVSTPAGTFETVLVVRRDPDSRRENRFWLAPKYAWLPVKMQQFEPGDATYTFTLDHLKWLAAETNR